MCRLCGWRDKLDAVRTLAQDVQGTNYQKYHVFLCEIGVMIEKDRHVTQEQCVFVSALRVIVAAGLN